MTLRTFCAVIACCAFVAACGGGGSASPAGPAAAVAGLYEGRGGSARASELLILDDGRYYLVYGLTSVSAAPLGGVVVGSGAANGTGFASTDAHDFNLLTRTLATGTLTTTTVAKASASSTVVHADTSTSTYAGTYDAASQTSASAALLAGTYAGELAGLGGTDASVFSIDALGIIAGTTSGSCTYAGLALPRSRGNVYDLTLTFRAGCASAGSTLHGHAFLSGKTVYAITASGDLATLAAFAGARP